MTEQVSYNNLSEYLRNNQPQVVSFNGLASISADLPEDEQTLLYNPSLCMNEDGTVKSIRAVCRTNKTLYEFFLMSRFICHVEAYAVSDADIEEYTGEWMQKVSGAVKKSFDANHNMARALKHYLALTEAAGHLTPAYMQAYFQQEKHYPSPEVKVLKLNVSASGAISHVEAYDAFKQKELHVNRIEALAPIYRLTYKELAKYLQRLMNNQELAEMQNNKPSVILDYVSAQNNNNLYFKNEFHCNGVFMKRSSDLTTITENEAIAKIARYYGESLDGIR